MSDAVSQSLPIETNILIRADASIGIGSGHVMRCLTLAHGLRHHGASVCFVCLPHEGNLAGLIQSKGFDVELLPDAAINQGGDAESTIEYIQDRWKPIGHRRPVDSIIVDHYSLDVRWESKLRPFTKRIVVIDDLANREHCCDVLLDQNLYEDMYSRYDDLIPDRCTRLLGPKYALLRDDFKTWRTRSVTRKGVPECILVFFGGMDSTNETAKTLKALSLFSEALTVNVVVGSSNPHKSEIESLCDTRNNFNFLCQVDNMAELMSRADLAIGAGGATTWERCFLGLPALLVTVADNQVVATEFLANHGLTWYLGKSAQVTANTITYSLQRFFDNEAELEVMSRQCFELFEDYNLSSTRVIESVLGK